LPVEIGTVSLPICRPTALPCEAGTNTSLVAGTFCTCTSPQLLYFAVVTATGVGTTGTIGAAIEGSADVSKGACSDSCPAGSYICNGLVNSTTKFSLLSNVLFCASSNISTGLDNNISTCTAL